ncbi:MAG TPA: TIGR03084 family metal-binding protein [Acidimicrobiia bacterium]|nr:TIGR03084 family metal-binding protein [Acidimicrobiia bacterium]
MADLEALCADAVAEHDDVRAILTGIPEADWDRPTPAAGWTVRDQISHLGFFDGTAALSMSDPDAFRASLREAMADIEAYVARAAAYGLGISGAELLDKWTADRLQLVRSARAVPEGVRVPWYGPDMAVASSVTARIMETWAHGQDVADALGAKKPLTGRLRHVCDIGIRARPFSYRNRRLEVPETPLRVELTAPDGERWEWGPAGAADRVSGPALDFALVVTQRRLAGDTALVVEGDDARTWISSVAQAFAGEATMTDPGRAGLPI